MRRKTGRLTALIVEVGLDGRTVVRSPVEEVLRSVKEKGSLALAAKTLGLSYTYLWTFLGKLSGAAGGSVIEGRRGGMLGGGAALTPRGEGLLKSHSYLREAVDRAVHEVTLRDAAVRDLVVIGSQCVGLEILQEIIRGKKPDFNPLVMHVGSTKGLEAVRDGEADVAGIHLLDEKTGTYNLPFLKELGLTDVAVLVRGYLRRQGLMVKKGNPKGIQGLKDLLLGDLVFINRNRGSGARILLDIELAKIARQRATEFESLVRRVKGYQNEAMSSLEVAEAVSQGRVDVGIGIEAEAVAHGLDFIHIAEEQYDLVIRRDRLGRRGVRLFLDALSSNQFKELLREKAAGLNATSQTGKILT